MSNPHVSPALFLRQSRITDLSKDKATFKVPQKSGCTETIQILSNIAFDSFKFRLAEAMDISVNRLNVAYTLSTWPQKESPAALSKVSHLVGLWETLAKEKDRLENVRRKGNNAKDLFVKIKDLNDAKGGKAKGGKAKGKDKKVSRALTESDVLTHKHGHRPKSRITLRKAVTRRRTARAAMNNPRLQRRSLLNGLWNSIPSSSAIGKGRRCVISESAGRRSIWIQEK